MSTASQRRKAKRLKLQAPFAEKVREVAREMALRMPRRAPEPVRGMEYVERIENSPVHEHETYANRGAYTRQIVWLKSVVGDGRPVPRRFIIPYVDERDIYARRLGKPLEWSPACRNLEFMWTQWAVRAGTTEVRWLVPELVGAGMGEDRAKAYAAARKAAAYGARALQALSYPARVPGYAFEYYVRDVKDAYEALLEWMGHLDPDSTREVREREANAAARSMPL